MDDIEFSKHALERMRQREITQNQVRTVIHKPDSVVETGDRSIYQSLMESESGNTYLYRVFVNTKKEPNLVITVYKTSKVEKYR